MKNKHMAGLVTLGMGLFILSQTVFTVGMTEQVMVMQFNRPVQKITKPGLHVKLPFIQQISSFDKRMLDVDPPAEEVILADQKRLVVDTFARYRIIDMEQYYSTLQNNESVAVSRLDNIINSTTRKTLGNAKLSDILSEKRTGLMATLEKEVNAAATDSKFGVEIVDVRIGRADLPQQTSQSIFSRMKTEREREAAEFRAKGQEIGQEIKSKADKERTILLAEADKQSQIMRGQGDEQAIKVYATAFKKDPEFYAFYRTMQAYREGLGGDNTTLVLETKGDFFRYFNEGMVSR